MRLMRHDESPGCSGCGRLPDDVLQPIWLMEIEAPRYGPGAIALDPREACYVLANGAELDGRRFVASFEGWDGRVRPDGRVVLRLDPVERELGFVDAAACAAAREAA